ncbi:hypothetical protein ACQEVB_38140 [Pseudonocardia sp. CA-107938]|uniref:hypothetical protein n=1 Tax=Pseudonocardia sp. CA-107938 TaxID=3240021 RepID=UPI003D90B13E
MELPADVARVCSRFTDLVDAAVPGLLAGLHLHGSLTFGEYHAGRSDVDAVAVLTHRPDESELAALRAVHGTLAAEGGPDLDVAHLLATDLARPPDDCPDVPTTLARAFAVNRAGINPVTWHELAERGISVRGQLPPVWTDPAALRAFTRRNLEQYWATRIDLVRTYPDSGFDPQLVTWFVLGAPRLHHLLATGAMTSKDGAGRFALATYDERWHPLVRTALGYRATGVDPDPPAEPAARGKAVVAFVEEVLAAAL